MQATTFLSTLISKGFPVDIVYFSKHCPVGAIGGRFNNYVSLKSTLNLVIYALEKLYLAFPKGYISWIVTGTEFLKVVIFPRVVVLDWDP